MIFSIRVLFITFVINLSYGITFGSIFNTIINNINYYSFSTIFEQCDKRWVKESISGLEGDMQQHVFGQHLALEVVLAALTSHSTKLHRKKPLVLNFHGWPGGGKGYVANFIVKNWFKKGVKSQYVRKYTAKLDFPLESNLYNYQNRLQSELQETVGRCPKAMFIFDEVDKYPPHVLDGIKPFLDYNNDINGYDFREAIFIFITNTGDKLITKITLEKFQNGIQREDLQMQDFEQALKTMAFNDKGGFYQSDLIKHHLIDHVVPFLPLERLHVGKCVEVEVMLQSGDPSLITDATSEILEEVSFGPPEIELYSTNGCKGVHEKVSRIIERKRRKDRLKRAEL